MKPSLFYSQVQVLKQQTQRALSGTQLPKVSCVTLGQITRLASQSLIFSSERRWQRRQQCPQHDRCGVNASCVKRYSPGPGRQEAS